MQGRPVPQPVTRENEDICDVTSVCDVTFRATFFPPHWTLLSPAAPLSQGRRPAQSLGRRMGFPHLPHQAEAPTGQPGERSRGVRDLRHNRLVARRTAHLHGVVVEDDGAPNEDRLDRDWARRRKRNTE